MSHIKSITPIDGRYNYKCKELINYFSEYALLKYRLQIEIEYLIYLNKTDICNYKFTDKDILFLKSIYTNFNSKESKTIKNIEKVTNHDVKSIEYYIKSIIESNPVLTDKNISTLVHFGLTSQDINSSSYILSIKNCINTIIIPNINSIFNTLLNYSNLWKDIIILTRTHGQPASPSLLGKEILVYIERIDNQLTQLKNVNYKTKFGGAIGNFNSLHFSNPNINWIKFADNFIESLDLTRNKYTTQIDHYDNYSEIFDIIKRLNNIFIDLCQDIWLYISLNYFCLKINDNEVGSSTMPHKVNPINFENAEGNFLLANNLLQFLSDKLPKSRLQRDLTDSTILRNLGIAFSYTLIGYSSLLSGLQKINVDKFTINRDLENNYIIIAEGLQTKLKLLGINDSYEIIKSITRTQCSDTSIKDNLYKYINSLPISDSEKESLLKITPFNYYGIVPKNNYINK